MAIDFKKILVAIDFSDYSRDVGVYASYLADKTNAELIILSVLNQRDIDAAAVYSRLVGKQAVSVDDFTSLEVERRQKRVEEVLGEVGLSELNRKVYIRIGNPFQEIMKAILEFDVGLIVMGTRGSSKNEEFTTLTGSVAEKIFKHSPVPVLSIREDLQK